MSDTPSPAPIVIVAPCPLGKGAVEGWMSRIRAIDGIFAGQKRIYLDVVSGNAPEGPPQEIVHKEASEYRIDMNEANHRLFVENCIRESRFVYVHTVHLGRFLLPWYMTGKIVTDVHGIVPEEERMMGRPVHGDFYEAVEATIVMASRLLVVVTEAMKAHLLAKYPETRAQFLILPIIEPHAVTLDERRIRNLGEPYRAIYAGGTQAWQNISETLKACSSVTDLCRFEFLSHEHAIIRDEARSFGLEDTATFRVVDKTGLASAYREADFGFVLRDDVAVNRVSCPTKLSEYLWFGVIPVVKSPYIGDFSGLGFAYLTAEEFAAGLFPDEESLGEMRRTNRALIETLSQIFGQASSYLATLSLPNRITGDGFAGLAVGWQHLVFPNQAELYLFDEGMQYQTRALAGRYDTLLMHFDPPVPARSLRLVPLLSAMRVTLSSLEITLSSDSAIPSLSGACTGEVEAGESGALTVNLPQKAPYIDFSFSERVIIKCVRYHARFNALGPEAHSTTFKASSQASCQVRFIKNAQYHNVSTLIQASG
jgi:hypothetical protein